MQLNREDLKKAYTGMCLIREFEDAVHIEFASGILPGFVHLYAGEESSAMGVCMNLNDRDTIASTHRGHGHCIAKGCDAKTMMKELFGKKDGICGGKGGSMHIADLTKGMLGANGIVGGGPPLVCGSALTFKTKKTGNVSVCFLGDGASNQGTTAESLNLASILKLPAIFIVEDKACDVSNGIKGLGEHVLIPTAPAILNGIRNATGAKINTLPATPARVLSAMKEMGF